MLESGVGTGAGAAAKSAASHATAVTVYGTAGIGLVAAILAMAVVFMARMPRSPKEWAVGLISTVVSSLSLGSAVVVKFGLLDWARASDPFESWVGMVAIGGVVFSCGLVGWAIVRWSFNWINAREGKQLDEVLQDAKRSFTPTMSQRSDNESNL